MLFLTHFIVLVTLISKFFEGQYLAKHLPTGQDYFFQNTTVEKEPDDSYEYQLIKLTNGLEILLISNENLQRAHASLSINVGFKDDPEGLRGLAHLCEHILHNGNKKYPESGSYNSFFSQYQGYYDAQTRFDETVYFFELDASKFEEGLDRLAHMFIEPLFNENDIDKELDILDQEIKSRISSDEYRIAHIFSIMGNPQHPFTHRFGGTRKTLLGSNNITVFVLKEKLNQFYIDNYSSDIMKLVVIGKESIEQLINMVVPKFTLIKNKNKQLEPKPEYVDPFNTEDQKLVHILPIKEDYRLILQFKIPNQEFNYNSKPYHYLDFTLCHHNENSVLNQFKQSLWAFNMTCGVLENYQDFGIFMIEVHLMPNKEGGVVHLISTILSTIKTISKYGIHESVFNRIKEEKKLDYMFNKPSHIYELGYNKVSVLHLDFPPQLVLGVNKILYDYRPNEIRNFLESFSYKNLRVAIVSPNNKTLDLKTESLLGVQYAFKKFSEYNIKEFKEPNIQRDFKLPEENPFLSRNFSIQKDKIFLRAPKKSVFRSNGKLYFFNNHFNEPKAIIKTTIWNQYSDQSNISLQHYVLFNIWRDIIKLGLDDDNFNYDFNSAGYQYELTVKDHQIELSVIGFNEHIQDVQSYIIKAIKYPSLSEPNLKLCKRNFIMNHKNLILSKPIIQGMNLMKHGLNLITWSTKDIIDVAQTITLNQVIKFSKPLISKGSITMLIGGNLKEEDAKSIYDQTLQDLALLAQSDIKEFLFVPPIAFETSNSSYVYQQSLSPGINTYSIIYYLQLYNNSSTNKALTMVLGVILSNHIFEFLRITNKISYTFKVEHQPLSLYSGGLLIQIESTLNSTYLEQLIEEFLLTIKDVIDKLDYRKFYYLKYVVLSELKHEQTKLDSLAQIYWSHILYKSTSTNYDNLAVINSLKSLSQHQLREFVNDRVLATSSYRHKLSIHLTPHDTEYIPLDSSGKLISNLTEWRTTI